MADPVKIGAGGFGKDSKNPRRPREQVNPVRQQRRNRDIPHKILFSRRKLSAQSREPKNQNGKSIGIEDHKTAKHRKDQWVPLQRAPEIEVEKCDRAAGGAAGETRMARDCQEQAVRPGQTERKPAGSQSKSNEADTKPNELVIDRTGSERPANKTHGSTLLAVLLHQSANANTQHQAKNEYSTAANDDRQKDRHHSATDIGFMASTNSDAINDQAPD